MHVSVYGLNTLTSKKDFCPRLSSKQFLQPYLAIGIHHHPIFDNLYLRCRLKVLPCYHRGGHITIMAVEMQLIVADGEESIKVQSNLVPLKRSFHKHIGCHGNKLYGRAEPCGVTSFRKDSMHMFKLS